MSKEKHKHKWNIQKTQIRQEHDGIGDYITKEYAVIICERCGKVKREPIG